MERVPGLLKKITSRRMVKEAAGAGFVATTVVASHTVGALQEHEDQLLQTAGLTGAILITYALLRRTLESAYHRDRIIGWGGFLATAAAVADHIYNAWS